MVLNTMERHLLPAPEQLGRFWELRRGKWVDEALKRIRTSDEQTARLVQQQTALTEDLGRHSAVLGRLEAAHHQLQAEHCKQGEQLRSRIDAHAALKAVHTSLQTDTQALRNQLSATERALANLHAARNELDTQHQTLIQAHARQAGALEAEQAEQLALLRAHAALDRHLVDTRNQLLNDLRRHQELLQQQISARDGLC